MTENRSVYRTVLTALEKVPAPWTEVLRLNDGDLSLPSPEPEPGPYSVADIYLDHTGYRARVHAVHDTDGGDHAEVRCFRKDRQTPTHEEIVLVLGQLFGPHLLVERDYGGGKDHWCEVEYHPGYPCGWNIFDDGEEYDPDNNPTNYHLGLQLTVKLQPEVPTSETTSSAQGLQATLDATIQATLKTSLPEPWTLKSREDDPVRSSREGETDFWLDHPDYTGRLNYYAMTDRPTEIEIEVTGHRKDKQTPTHEELVSVFSPLFDPSVRFAGAEDDDWLLVEPNPDAERGFTYTDGPEPGDNLTKEEIRDCCFARRMIVKPQPEPAHV